MRKAYEAVAYPAAWDYSNPLIKETVEACEKIADIEIAEQAKVYEQIIASLEKELATVTESNAARGKMLNAITESNLQRIRAHI